MNKDRERIPVTGYLFSLQGLLPVIHGDKMVIRRKKPHENEISIIIWIVVLLVLENCKIWDKRKRAKEDIA